MIKFNLVALTLMSLIFNCKAENQTVQTVDEIKSFLKGHEWVSITTELRPQEDRTGTGKVQPFYVTRSFQFFEGEKFIGTITSYGDPYGKIPLVKFEFKGHVEWKGEHPVAKGAQKIDYVLDEGFIVTPLNSQFANLLNQIPVPGLQKFEMNVAQDILKKPFPLFNIQEGQIVKDYDLIYIYNGILFMGAKHVDGTPFDKPENRPHLLQIPLVKKG
jgi:hypothetical protein